MAINYMTHRCFHALYVRRIFDMQSTIRLLETRAPRPPVQKPSEEDPKGKHKLYSEKQLIV